MVGSTVDNNARLTPVTTQANGIELIQHQLGQQSPICLKHQQLIAILA